MLTSWKKDPEMAFLTEAYTDNLQQKLKDLHGAWMRCFDKNSPPRLPFSRRKSDNRDSIHSSATLTSIAALKKVA